MIEWGEDPDKWVIQKSSFGAGWCVFPPRNGEAWSMPSFESAVAAMVAATPKPFMGSCRACEREHCHCWDDAYDECRQCNPPTGRQGHD